ncbi:MAG: glycosyltransferase [Candidatus Bathyarchaeia archaeon]|jgi:cellulose synthase/poly-beta-1,6-N-acetylglucosamine synthase-like glycosyltransferase
MLESPVVSIIIPCKEIDDYAKECVKHCRQLDYGSYEIILLPDDALEKMDGVRVIPTGPVTPGAKRNIGVVNSSGEVCAFIDSDAYPRGDWLSNAVTYFDDPQVAAVGGPGLTPEEDGFMQRASGYVLSSFMVGSISSRYKTMRVSESDDIHSCNFVARKAVVNEVGGWNEKYWPGEDTLMCLAIKKLGKKLIESSDVVVYHHRRSLFRPHLKQVSKFGEHRGLFAKKFPENSLKLTYFFPSLLVFSLLVGIVLSLFFPFFAYVVLFGVVVYLISSLIAAALQVRNVKLLLSVWSGIIVTHIVYGSFFLSGLAKRDLKR